MRRSLIVAVQGLVLVALAASPSFASFHFMQIEQPIGGVCGDVSQQAVQLRMRAAGQNQVSGSRVNGFDAAGMNAVLLHDMTTDVTGATLGSRVLLATAAFASAQGITPDFTLTAPIPATYLQAGRLTFTDDGVTIYWSLAWGGAGYTGSTTGSVTNDADGNFGPPFAGVLPWTTSQSLLFPGAASALSTNNAADYALTSGAAMFVNNLGVSTTVSSDCVFGDGFETGNLVAWSTTVP